MFRESINRPIDPIPVEYTDTLVRLDNEPDYSLTCLGIAMLKPRIENYKGISGVYKNFTDEISCVQDMFELEKEFTECPTLCYYTYSVPAEDRKEIETLLKEHGFEIKENIGAFIKEKANIQCIAAYHKEKNYAGIFINSKELRFYHVLISFISLLFANLFKDIPLRKPEDYNLIVSLSKNDKNLFVQRVQESVTPYITEFRRLMLCALLKSMHEVKIQQALGNVNDQRGKVEQAKRALADAIVYLKDLSVVYEGLRVTETNDDVEEELVDYLSSNKAIHNLRVNGNILSFSVATLLNNYNENAWETFKQRGYIYDGNYKTTKMLDAFRDRGNRKILLDNIFSESPEFAVKIAGNYKLDLYSCSVEVNKMYDYEADDPIYKSYMPNPHIKLFACLGGYDRRIPEALQNRNYIGAVELCCASAGSVDLDETEQTFRPFLGWLLSSKEKVLHRKDGVDMTPEEALIYLIDKEKANETDSDE